MYLARSQGRQVSREGLIAGLPLHDGRLVPSLVMRAADRAGLESTLVECPLEALAEDALPVILLLEDVRGNPVERLSLDAVKIPGGRFKSDVQKLKIEGDSLLAMTRLYLFCEVAK